jgi:hypothetical protein
MLMLKYNILFKYIRVCQKNMQEDINITSKVALSNASASSLGFRKMV